MFDCSGSIIYFQVPQHFALLSLKGGGTPPPATPKERYIYIYYIICMIYNFFKSFSFSIKDFMLKISFLCCWKCLISLCDCVGMMWCWSGWSNQLPPNSCQVDLSCDKKYPLSCMRVWIYLKLWGIKLDRNSGIHKKKIVRLCLL